MHPSDYGVNVNGIVLGIHSGKNAFIQKITSMGYDANSYDIIEIVNQSKEFFEENDVMTDQELLNIMSRCKYKVLVNA